MKMGLIKEQIIEQNFKTELTIQETTPTSEIKDIDSISDEDRHKAIENMKCAICGKKLYASCYAEDSYAIECLDCELLYAE